MRSIRRWLAQAPRPRFRVGSLIALVALAALGLTGWREYYRADRVWRRAVRGVDHDARVVAWGEANRGRIEGLSPERTRAEVVGVLAVGDDDARAAALIAYPLIEPDPRLAIPRLAPSLRDPRASIRRAAARAIKISVRPDGSGVDLALREFGRAFEHPDADFRRVVVDALGDLAFRVAGSRAEALARVRLGLADPDAGVRIAAALGLARLGQGSENWGMLRGYVADHQAGTCQRPHCPAALTALGLLATATPGPGPGPRRGRRGPGRGRDRPGDRRVPGPRRPPPGVANRASRRRRPALADRVGPARPGGRRRRAARRGLCRLRGAPADRPAPGRNPEKFRGRRGPDPQGPGRRGDRSPRVGRDGPGPPTLIRSDSRGPR